MAFRRELGREGERVPDVLLLLLLLPPLPGPPPPPLPLGALYRPFLAGRPPMVKRLTGVMGDLDDDDDDDNDLRECYQHLIIYRIYPYLNKQRRFCVSEKKEKKKKKHTHHSTFSPSPSPHSHSAPNRPQESCTR